MSPSRNPPTRQHLFENTAQPWGTPPWLAWDKTACESSMNSPGPHVAVGCLPRPSCPPHQVARTQVREDRSACTHAGGSQESLSSGRAPPCPSMRQQPLISAYEG